MRRVLLVLGLALCVFAPTLNAQWADTSFTDSHSQEKVNVLLTHSTDSVLTPDGSWKHPSIVWMCTAKFPHILDFVWVGTRPTPSIPDSANVRILVRVLIKADSNAVIDDVWQVNNPGLIIFPAKGPNTTSGDDRWLNSLLGVQTVRLAYAQENGGFKEMTFDVSHFAARLQSLLAKCPLVKLPVSFVTPRS